MNGRLNRRLIGVLCARLPELMLGVLADPRARAARWPLQTILVAVVLGLTANCRNLRQVERLTNRLSKALRKRLEVASRLPDTTVRDVLVEFDPHDLRPALHRQVKLAQRRKALKPVGLPFGVGAIDGRSTSTPITDDNCFAQTQQGPHVGLLRRDGVRQRSPRRRPARPKHRRPGLTPPGSAPHLHLRGGGHRTA